MRAPVSSLPLAADAVTREPLRSQRPSGPGDNGHVSLRIGLVGTAFWPIVGGMEVYLRDLARALVRGGHVVHVGTRFVRERPPSMAAIHASVEPRAEYREEGVMVHVLSPRGGRRPLLHPVHRLHFRSITQPVAIRLMEWAFQAALREACDGCDVLHYSGTGREMLGFAVAESARRRGIPFVVTPHTHAGTWGDSPLDFDLYRRADRVVALTDDERARLIAGGLSAERVTVLGHGVSVAGTGDAQRFRTQHGIEGPIVFYLGRKAAYKGYGRLRRAAEIVWQDRPDVHFVAAGPDEEETASLRGTPDSRFHDLGIVSDAEREDAYAACDVFCLPSTAEAFGLVYQEAWAYGKPVVSLQLPTLEELIGRAGGGLLVEQASPAVADAVLRLLGDASLRARLGTAGQAVAASRTWDAVAESMAAIYIGAMTEGQTEIS